MLPKNRAPQLARPEGTSNEVVVKLKTDNQARSILAAPARAAFDTAGVGAERDVFTALFERKVIEDMSPLFPDPARRGMLTLVARGQGARAPSIAMDDEQDQDLSGLNIIRCANAADAESVASELDQDPLVEYAHVPAVKIPAQNNQVDPLQNRQWGLSAIDFFSASHVPGYDDAREISIAILDSGIDPNHPDIQGIVSSNQNFSTFGPNDASGHGTHVAGIIAALVNNGVGITGLCQSHRLMVLKGLVNPYQSRAYYQAIRFAFNNEAQVLNFSLGGGYDPTEELLIRTAISKGVIVVAAMGNDYLRGNPTSYPAALPDVIAVGACNEMDRRAPFSQTGPHIDLMAPGANILSTVPTYRSTLSSTTDYDSWDGTSMATPFVTAVVALMLAKNPGASRSDVVNALHRSADKIDHQTGFTHQLGYGRLNLPGAIHSI